MPKGSVELAGKLSYFSGDLAWLDDVEAAAAALAGGHLEVVTGSIVGLDTGGTVVIRANDQDREVVKLSMVAGAEKVVDRGDPAAEDFSSAAFTKDGAWHDLDLSSIVPANATWVLLKVGCLTTVGTGYIQLRKKGKANAIAVLIVASAVATVGDNGQGWVALPASRIIEYYVNSGSTWGSMSVTVLGWTLPIA